MTREASHMHFVNDGSGCRPLERGVALPIVSVEIDHDALHGSRGVIAFQARRFAAVTSGNQDGAAIRVQEDLVGIVPHATCGIERSLDAVAVELPGFYAGHERVP